jgi:hypothetical protein
MVHHDLSLLLPLHIAALDLFLVSTPGEGQGEDEHGQVCLL